MPKATNNKTAPKNNKSFEQTLWDTADKLRGSVESSDYDILKGLAVKYEFEYPEEKLLVLSKAVKGVVDDKTKYTDWNRQENIRAELKVDLILLLAEHGYPPVDRDEVYQEIFEQAENFKKHQKRGR
ncbi:MAG: hypothetical protein CL388_06765 [Acidiferrobacteraceae bacterium]|jgi:type I restriction enzyme R subunit|nr:hypothetical protein [Acidiferrobacteraceae bacterium]MDP6672184.1 DUF3387 domain-containing protein [Arenicellales bacterium]MDP6725376.1 DUF3387 domain-containing protein [Arenicellales bacterium]|tara:strand:+ start:1677 stop:2057 length:381 start_codon:yes stop_codon:yes gene_type:complete